MIAISFLLVWILGIGCAVAATGVVKAVDAPQAKTITWRNAGPGGGGWIQSIACDPVDSNVLYVGCDVGGFYISFDGGRHYEIRNNGLRNFYIESITVHPKNSKIIILGTESGIFRTTDQGIKWQWIRNGFPAVRRFSYSAPIGCVAFDPKQPHVVFAGIGRPKRRKEGKGMIYRSEDTGLTWVEVAQGQLPADAIVKDIEVNPEDSRMVLAATQRGVFRSTDGGKTWVAANKGLPHVDVEELAFSPSEPKIVYASLRTTARDKERWNGGVCRSEDAGLTWQPRNSGLPRQVGKRGASPYMTANIKELVVDPRNPDVLYAGGQSWVASGVFKSTNGGRSWVRTTYHRGDPINMDFGWIKEWGPSVQCMAISRVKPGFVFFGTGGFVCATEDAGKTWQQRYCELLPDGRFTGTGLEVTCLNDVVPDPVRPGRIYLCYADVGLLISDDNGKTFRRSNKGMKHGGNVFTVVVDPAALDTIWAGTGQWKHNQGDICRSDDGGMTWNRVGYPKSGLPDGQTRHMVLDLASPRGKRRLLASLKGHGIYETLNGGKNWKSINGNLPAESAKLPQGLAMNPSNAYHIIMAAGGSVAKGAGVYETLDGGKSWKRLSLGLDVGEIQCLAVDPRSFRTLYLGVRKLYDRAVSPHVTRPGGVFKSTDGGVTWRQILDYHFVKAVAINPRNGQIIYAGTCDHPYHDDCRAEGVLKSKDGGRTWAKENTGLSLWQVNSLRINPNDPSILYLGTGGNGMFIGQDSTVSK